MIQSALLKLLDTNTILVGHSLECDLQALKFCHPHIIDTSVIYQHSRGPPSKPSLKWLAQKWLKRRIQDNEVKGHDSAEDAVACVDLLKMKVARGKDFGLFNVDVESLFTRLKRKGIDSAVVEYRSRGTGSFYGDAVRSCISVETDEQVVPAVLEALSTDHRLVFARMKDVESASQWKDYDSAGHNEQKMRGALTALDNSIRRLWEELPPCSGVILVSGSGDPREMSRLFARKKVADIHGEWTDDDQRQYVAAVDTARTGAGFIAVK
jgi:RNA exonuclease